MERAIGPYRLLEKWGKSGAGVVYRAERDGRSAAVWVPPRSSSLHPQVALEVSARASASPPYFAVEVRQGPDTTRALQWAVWQLGNALALASPRILPAERSAGLRKKAPERSPAGVRRRLAAKLLAALGAVGALLLSAHGEVPADGGAEVAVADTTTLTGGDLALWGARRLPVYSNQARPPCDAPGREIDGGCWVELAAHPPCVGKSVHEWSGKCWLPVGAPAKDPRAKDGPAPEAEKPVVTPGYTRP
jgi:hypothetical protein